MIDARIAIHLRFINGTNSEKIVSIPSGSLHAGLSPAHQKMKRGRLAPLFVILDIFNRGSRVLALFFVRKENDTGFPITNVGNDRLRYR